jgi:hypothetical protein
MNMEKPLRTNHWKLAIMLFLPFMIACSGGNQSNQEQSAEAVEEAPEEEWIMLFNGENLDGWKRYGADEIGPLWSAQNGTILCDGEGLGEGSGEWGGSLITLEQFGNFELEVEWKISPGGNSGILYHVVESPEYSHAYSTGPEYQVLDDGGWKGDELTPAQMAGSNYDMYAAPEDKKLNPAGQWNSSRIIYNDGHVEHYLNGKLTVEFDEGSEEFKERYENSKWPDYPGWNKYKTGSIALQDHGAPVWFRNIRIRRL